jgi:hypothetical protein
VIISKGSSERFFINSFGKLYFFDDTKDKTINYDGMATYSVKQICRKGDTYAERFYWGSLKNKVF